MKRVSRLFICFLVLGGSVDGLFFENIFKPPKSAQPKTSDRMPELLSLVKKTEDVANSALDEDIKNLMIEISKSRKGDQRENLPGTWELLYTTEKETNFIKNSWPFATVSEITQVIDNNMNLGNIISFTKGGSFEVGGVIMPVDDGQSEYDRVEFKFDTAVIKVWGQALPLPPVGAGYFDTMYADNDYRLSQDSRGDWSVFRRLS